ncbi:MAG: GNAT family N-acetyltransferase [Candidatus Saccharibacteria bacterium]|nr:GNAT family N-acetyltransferase [Pseudorhodobacter sp.]
MTRAELKTARLLLRPVSPQDKAAVVACLNDIAVSGWLAVVPFPYFPADFKQFQADYAVPGETYAVEDEHGFVGILGVEDRTLGYWFAPASQGKGYATEAARAALAAHFDQSPTPIASGYFTGNSPSANVLRKLGFLQTGQGQKHCRALGRDRPHVDLSLTRDAFAAALPIEARSARLTYRAMYATDTDALHAIVSHFDVVRQLASYPWPANRDFTATRAQPYHGRGFVWGVFLASSLIGTVAITEDELGYMFAPDHWGQGYATEACQTVIARAFAEGRSHLKAGIWADNPASLGLLHKLGFRITADDLTWNKARGDVTPGHLLRLDRPTA